MEYIALIRKEPESAFGVEFPDFPGCITAGDSLDEAYANAREALAFHIRGMLEDGEALPAPSSFDDIMHSDEAVGAVATLVDIPSRGHVVRVNITMEEGLLQRIDEAAARRGFPTRSGFLAEGARRLLEEPTSRKGGG